MKENYDRSSDSTEEEIKLLRDRIVRLEVLQRELITIVRKERISLLDFRDKIFFFLFIIFIFLCSVVMMQDEVEDDAAYSEDYISQDEEIKDFIL
jgi:hypothetical protein